MLINTPKNVIKKIEMPEKAFALCMKKAMLYSFNVRIQFIQ